MTDIQTKHRKIVKIFKNLCVEFIDNLYELLPDNCDLLLVKTLLASLSTFGVSDEMLISNFTSKGLPYKDKIKNRDEKFFLEHSDSLICQEITNQQDKSLASEKVKYFSDIWKSGNIDDEDKCNIWKFMDRFVELSEQYKKLL